MKRVLALAATLVVLCGCSGADAGIGRAMKLRERLLAAESCGFQAEITADYADAVYTFSMDCRVDPDGTVHFTVTEPATISGITGTLSAEGGKLTFDDTSLGFDLLAEEQFSPVSAPWVFMRTLRGGYLSSTVQEGELLRLSIDDSYEEDALRLDIWLDGSDCPVRADIMYDGRRILSLKVDNFTFV